MRDVEVLPSGNIKAIVTDREYRSGHTLYHRGQPYRIAGRLRWPNSFEHRIIGEKIEQLIAR